jgi:hypothetical protein
MIKPDGFALGMCMTAQATLAPPASGKMAKALVLCYSVLSLTFYFPAITGYWAFGNQVRSNLLKSLMPGTGPWLAPSWLLILAVVLVLLQLIAIALVKHMHILHIQFMSWNMYINIYTCI